MGNSVPVISVVIVVDFSSGQAKGWDELRKTLAALSTQSLCKAAEFILVECEEQKHEIPPDLSEILPLLKIVLASATSSYELKNAGVLASSAEIVVLLDADCVPEPGWLKTCVNVLQEHPDVCVVSGRTVYAGESLVQRAMALLLRSYVDRGQTAMTRHISNNNAVFRRSVYLAHPLPTNAGVHASMLQAESIIRDGGCLLFEPRMRVVHAYDGWATERDIRLNMGYGVFITRLLDRRMPHAWMFRFGYLSIPLVVLARILNSWRLCLQFGRHYGVTWYELPIVFLLGGVVCTLEIPGMIQAIRRKPIANTSYR